MKNYRAARKRVNVSVGESVRIIRELQGLSQNELARHTGISQATSPPLRTIGCAWAWSERRCSRALKCHPGVLVFPGWVVATEAAA